MSSQPTSPNTQPPPNLPSMPGESPILVGYLRNFALWARNGFAAKLDAQTALPGILLQASDPTTGTIPKVFLLQINSAGAIVITPQPLGGGRS